MCKRRWEGRHESGSARNERRVGGVEGEGMRSKERWMELGRGERVRVKRLQAVEGVRKDERRGRNEWEK